MKVKVLDGQSLFDIAIQHCGDVQAVYDIALLNNLSITDDVELGTELVVPEPFDRDIANYMKQKNITPKTAWHEQ
jgi:hypothetical protein